MKVRKPVRRLRQGWAFSLATCGVAMAVLLLFAGSARAQCNVNVAPGQTQVFQEASSGSATPPSSNADQAQGGYYDPNQNKAEAFALFAIGGAGITEASAYGEVDYQFCVSGNPNDTIPATIAAQVEWSGDIFSLLSLSVPGGPPVPSATGTVSVLDLGTSGSASPITLASASPLQTNFSPGGIKIFSAGGTYVNGSGPVSLKVNLTTGHVYSIRFQMQCDVHSNVLSVDEGCDFGSDVFSNASLPINVQSLGGPFYGKVDSLSISLGQDLYGTLISIKGDVDNLSAEVQANRQAIASADLTAEQENAQLLGILKQIASLLSTPQGTPTAPSASNPTPPKHPVSPAPLRIFLSEFQRCVQTRNPQAVQQCLKQLGTSEQSGSKQTAKAPAH